MKKIMILILMVFTTSCVSSKVTAIKDPDYQDKQFSKILVQTAFKDLDIRTYAENTFCKQIQTSATECVTAMKVLPMTREFSSDEYIKVIKDHHIDAVLFFSPDSVSSSSTYVPGTTYINKQNSGNYTAYNSGINITSTNIRFEIKLMDANNGKTAWYSTIASSGDASDLKVYIHSTATQSILKMKQDGLLKPKPITN